MSDKQITFDTHHIVWYSSSKDEVLVGAFSALGAAARGQLHGQQGAFVHRDVRESSDAHRYPTPCAVITSHHLGTHADQMFVSETQGESRFSHQ